MHLADADIKAMDRITRLNLINSITGIKPANLIGTKSLNGETNLAIFSSVVHLGSNPPLIGFVLRPQGEVRRHTYENIKETGVYTINAVNQNFIKRAHFTSAKFEKEVCEFDKSGLTPQYVDGFDAPFVQESNLKMGLQWVEELNIKSNNTQLIVGKIVHLEVPDNALELGGHLNLGDMDIAGISGLNSYYKLSKMAYFSYVREHFRLEDL